MSTPASYFQIEEQGQLGILSLNPYQGVALADPAYAQAIIKAIKKFDSDGKTVLLVSVPAGNFAPERMESFWESARLAPPDAQAQATRYARGAHLPLSVRRLETAVGQLLEVLHSTSLFKVIAVEGNIDFDLLGLLLAFDIRFCSRGASFENRVLDRGAVPGFGVVWHLARRLGQPKTVDLILNHQRLSAEEAQHLSLMTHLSNEGSTADEARKYAESLAGRSPIVLAALANATKYLECDFQEYLKQAGGGFTQVPPE